MNLSSKSPSTKVDNPDPQFRVQSCWSQAGIGTCFVLEQFAAQRRKNGLRIVLDLGCTPIFKETIKCSIVILSHGHIDHIAGVFGHARAHNLVYGGTPTYYVPSDLAPKLEKARDCLSDMDGYCQLNQNVTPPQTTTTAPARRDKGMLNMKIVPVSAGQEIELLPQSSSSKRKDNTTRFYLHPFTVSHGGHPSLGYTIISRQTVAQGLKEEYKGLDGKSLGALARSGVVIQKKSRVVERVEVCYTGDTCVDGLVNRDGDGDGSDVASESDNNRGDGGGSSGVALQNLNLRYLQEGFTARLLLCELTFLDPSDRDKARERGHLNIMDIEPILLSHGWGHLQPSATTGTDETDGAVTGGGSSSGTDSPNNERNNGTTTTVIFFHVSLRHGPARRVLDEICRSLPDKILAVSEVAIASFCDASTNDLSPVVRTDGCVSLSDYRAYRNGEEDANNKAKMDAKE